MKNRGRLQMKRILNWRERKDKNHDSKTKQEGGEGGENLQKREILVKGQTI